MPGLPGVRPQGPKALIESPDSCPRTTSLDAARQVLLLLVWMG